MGRPVVWQRRRPVRALASCRLPPQDFVKPEAALLRIAAVIETTPEQDFARWRAQGDDRGCRRGELLRDFMQVDGTGHFDWSIGLLPGSYTLQAVMMGEGLATVPFVVPATGLVENVVEVRIARSR
jgi:hypothetical protein